MKRIFLLLATIGFFGLQSCTINDGTPGRDGFDGQDAPINQVFEISRTFNNNNSFRTEFIFNQQTFASDKVLAFRLTVSSNNGADVWKPLPQTFYFNNGTLDYSFEYDFTQYDINIFMNGNDLNSIPTAFRTNQTFRIMIIPGSLRNKSEINKTLSYEEAIAKYKIDDSKVVKLK